MIQVAEYLQFDGKFNVGEHSFREEDLECVTKSHLYDKPWIVTTPPKT